jgi:hypothetical protein
MGSSTSQDSWLKYKNVRIIILNMKIFLVKNIKTIRIKFFYLKSIYSVETIDTTMQIILRINKTTFKV